MIKEFLMNKMIQSKLAGIPAAERAKIISAVEKNPDLFMKIAEEVKISIKSGKDQTTAAMEVMKKYESEFKGLM